MTNISNRASVVFFSMSLAAAGLLVPASASANIGDKTGQASNAASAPERVQPLMLADVVVQGNTPAAAPVAPVAAPVAQPVQPVVEAPTHSTVVEHESHNYMSTIALSALMGGVAGVLVGGAIYYLSDNQNHARRIAYWGAGGVLVGTAVGFTQIAVEESRLDRSTATNLPTDPAQTYRLALYQLHF
jgi:MFS family permease